jgi:hypothetical protein
MELSRLAAGSNISYKINKSFRLAAGYLYIRRSENPGELLSNRHRLYADILFKHNFNRFNLAYRCRFQSQQTDIYSSDDGYNPEFTLRHKITFKYDLNLYLSPYVSQEIFIPTNDFIDVLIRRTRSTAGMEYHLNKRNDLELYFLYQRELLNSSISNFYTIGIGYSLVLK